MTKGWNATVCELLFAHTGIELRRWEAALGRAFAFTADEGGYGIGGTVRTIEYEPGEFFRIWGDGELHVEWRPDGTCKVYRPLRHGGVPGCFTFADHEREEEMDAAA